MATVVSSNYDMFLYFLAIFLPPVSVFLKRGCAADFWINVCLSILGWIPGVIHAWWVFVFLTRMIMKRLI
ncbi:plasma membrane proteolipid Pmp3 [Psilocybe cubensis]|uniref:Plasma membrane proteolipid Pmp3 n=1 Tax=Psilocybe cubensis TaxID=181762 RepID=A0ACB8GQP0_PSICU|nr:plasma membrane proteolipid Pmp3 [Psilocybe cubensis]KAH9477687.1 plasma membrane proteolipid Pmp3 [Psilocybe cubensis]